MDPRILRNKINKKKIPYLFIQFLCVCGFGSFTNVHWGSHCLTMSWFLRWSRRYPVSRASRPVLRSRPCSASVVCLVRHHPVQMKSQPVREDAPAQSAWPLPTLWWDPLPWVRSVAWRKCSLFPSNLRFNNGFLRKVPNSLFPTSSSSDAVHIVLTVVGVVEVNHVFDVAHILSDKKLIRKCKIFDFCLI